MRPWVVGGLVLSGALVFAAGYPWGDIRPLTLDQGWMECKPRSATDVVCIVAGAVTAAALVRGYRRQRSRDIQ